MKIVIQGTRVDESTKKNHVDEKRERSLIEDPEEYQHLRQAAIRHT